MKHLYKLETAGRWQPSERVGTIVFAQPLLTSTRLIETNWPNSFPCYGGTMPRRLRDWPPPRAGTKLYSKLTTNGLCRNTHRHGFTCVQWSDVPPNQPRFDCIWSGKLWLPGSVNALSLLLTYMAKQPFAPNRNTDGAKMRYLPMLDRTVLANQLPASDQLALYAEYASAQIAGVQVSWLWTRCHVGVK